MTFPVAPARMPELDGLRGLAALSVFAYHGWMVSAWTVSAADGVWLFGANRLLSLGWSGVDLFFTLSAFLLSLPFVQAARIGTRQPLLGRYLARRAWRILPAYWVQLLIMALLLRAELSDPGALAAQALMLFNLGAAPLRLLVPVWWTLPVEFGFYLLLPVLALLLRPRRWPWLLLLIAAALGWRHQVLQSALPMPVRIVWADHLPGRLDQFVIGMLGAYAWVHADLERRLAARGRREALALAGVVAIALLHALPFWLGARAGPAASTHPGLLAWHSLASLALLPLLWAAAAGGSRALGWLGRPSLRWLGLISFSLYLWHYPLMQLALQFPALLPAGHVRPFLFLLALLPPCLLAAWLSWRLIEQPTQSWSRRRPATAVPRPA